MGGLAQGSVPEGMESMGFVFLLMLYGIHESLSGKDGVCHRQRAQSPCGNGTLVFSVVALNIRGFGGSSTLDSRLTWACKA